MAYPIKPVPGSGPRPRARPANPLAWAPAVACVALLAACQGPPHESPDVTAPSHSAAEIGLGQPFTLAVGQVADLHDAGFSVRFVGVASDSRCAVNVVCVWEGDAAAVVQTVRDGVAQDHQLHLPGETMGPRSVTVDGYRLSFDGLEPEPHTEKPIAADEYRATFRVVRER